MYKNITCIHTHNPFPWMVLSLKERIPENWGQYILCEWWMAHTGFGWLCGPIWHSGYSGWSGLQGWVGLELWAWKGSAVRTKQEMHKAMWRKEQSEEDGRAEVETEGQVLISKLSRLELHIILLMHILAFPQTYTCDMLAVSDIASIPEVSTSGWLVVTHG